MWQGRNRKSPRLKGFDYSSNGAYFVTIKTYQSEHLFGEIEGGEMKLNEYGDIVFWEWVKCEHVRKEIYLDDFVIMPNHFHGIVIIFHPDGFDGSANQAADPVGTTGPLSLRKAQHKPGGGKRSLSSMIGAFKLKSTMKINELRQTPKVQVWQGRFHDEIIRSERHLNNARQYIAHNPANWDTDEDNQP
jgi:putative transposase